MTDTAFGAARPDQIAYMGQVAALDAAREYKTRLLRLLDLRPGLTALDIGCGPGTDLAGLAAGVGATGTVIGVDRDPGMAAEARRRTGELSGVEVRVGDAHALPVEDMSVDRARIDRMLMHVEDPGRVLAELRRVSRPGAVIGLAEPDWDTLVVDSDDLETSRAFTRYTVGEVVRNAVIGRQLARLAGEAGFTVDSVAATSPLFRDVELADRILGLGRNTKQAIESGHIDEDRGRAWFASLARRPFLASFVFFTVVARA
jgi:ubiquinone/menaquinone biosynthesis C-methylase UbiE